MFSQDERNYQKFIHITKSQGLSHNSITAIEKDNSGYIWIGTKKGLNRFDGEKFKVFKTIDGDTSSLKTNRIYSLEKDSDGSLWIGTDKGIHRYNHKTGFIEPIKHTASKDPRLQHITSICAMRDSTMWFGAYGGIFILDKKLNTPFPFKKVNKPKGVLHRNMVMKIFQDSENTIWIGTSKGLYKATSTYPNTVSFIKSHNDEKKSGNIYVVDIAEDTDGNIWIGTRNKGLFLYSKINKRLVQIQDPSIPIEIRTLHFDLDNNLWIGSFDGLVKLQKNRNKHTLTYFAEKGFKVGDGVSSILLDNKIGLLIGGNFGGVKVWNTPYNSIKSIESVLLDTEIELGLVNAIVEDDMQQVYICTKKKGIIVLDNNQNIKRELTKILRNRFMGITVKSIILENGLLWIGTLEDGLVVFDTKKNQFIENRISKQLRRVLENCKVHSVSKTGDFLAIGTFGKGLILYNTKTKQMKNYPIGLNIRVVYFDRLKNLWIGSKKGLKKIEANDVFIDKIRIRDVERYGKEQPKIQDVLSITENNKGQLYIGTGNSGFYVLVNGKLERSNLKLNGVQSIVKENKNVWLATEKGIVRFDTDKRSASLYDQNYGLSTAEFRNQSFLNASNGFIYLGTTEGVVYFSPSEFPKEQKVASAVISSFNINGKEPKRVDKNSIKNLSSGENGITLSHDEPSFTINFSSFDYHAILNNLYEYRLVGLNDDWKVTTEAEVNYVVQKPGDYLFQVRNKTLLDSENYDISELKITLKPAPWKSTPAFVLYAFVGFLLIAGIYSILKSRHKLEIEQVKNLKEKEQFLSQIEFFTNLSHDFRTPLTLILAPLRQIIEQFKGSAMVYQKLLVVRKNADHLLHLINQILDLKKIDTELPKLKVGHHNVIVLMQEVYASFEEIANYGNYSFVFEEPTDEIMLYYDSLVIERVMYNVLSNAFKNTPHGGKIEIILNHTEEYVNIAVKDTGKGIDPEFIHKIFERFYEVANDINYKKQFTAGMGIGLHMAKKAIDSHKGKLEVESKKGIGTTFTIRLKKGTSHLQKHIAIESEDLVKTPNNFTAVVTSDVKNTSSFSFPEAIDSIPKKHTVLVVEDNDELRYFMVDLLNQHFFVEEAVDGIQGFSKVLQKDIDLIISDVVMPNMDGEQLCAKVKSDERTKHIPFILLTTQMLSSQRISGLESGADAYISKPFDEKELILTILNLLHTREGIKERFHAASLDSLVESNHSSEDERLYKQAMKIIGENIGNSSFELNAFCAELGISRNKLFKKVKEWTDKTPKEFIQLVRLKKASQLLETGEFTISEVCYMTGFSNPSYFATAFKKHYQMTPTEFAERFTSEL